VPGLRSRRAARSIRYHLRIGQNPGQAANGSDDIRRRLVAVLPGTPLAHAELGVHATL